jgi:hypothetical protein
LAVAGALGVLGGARPTGIGWLDAALLGLGGVAACACGRRARTVPLYATAALSALLQPASVPLLLGVLAMGAAVARRFQRAGTMAGAAAGGLAWAAAVGVPGEPGARSIALPLLGFGWVAWSARANGGRRFRRRFDRVAAVAGALALACSLLGGLAVVNARSHLDRGRDLLRSGLAAARVGDTDQATGDLLAARRALGRGSVSLGALWARPAWVVPGVSQNARALRLAVEEVTGLADVATTAAEEADLSSLRARQGRIDLAAVAAMDEPLVRVLDQLQTSRRHLATLQDAWLLAPVAERIGDLADELADAVPSVELALEGVRAAPTLLGADAPRTYLVLFTTPVEGRATTGFPGNFAELTFTAGRMEMDRFGRVSELNAGLPDGGGTITRPADYLARYSRFGPNRDWRNVPLSPDFPTIAAVAADLYPQSGGRPVDGVLSLDPVALAALLRFTGPVAVPGVDQPLTDKDTAQFLLRDQYVQLPDTPERVDALETLAQTTFDRLTATDLPGPRELGRVFGPIVEAKHLQLFAFVDGADFLDHLGITGRYPAVNGDFVSVTTSNAAGSKIDLFLRRSLDYDVTWDPATGEVQATATITLTNEAPAAGLPDYVIGNALGRRLGEEQLPPGWNNVFVTLYTPLDHDDATIDGQPLALSRIDELGRHALSTFVTIGPGATRTIVVQLTGSVPGPRYALDLAAQPLVEPEQVTLSVTTTGDEPVRATGPVTPNGLEATASFPLQRDQRITITSG